MSILGYTIRSYLKNKSQLGKSSWDRVQECPNLQLPIAFCGRGSVSTLVAMCDHTLYCQLRSFLSLAPCYVDVLGCLYGYTQAPASLKTGLISCGLQAYLNYSLQLWEVTLVPDHETLLPWDISRVPRSLGNRSDSSLGKVDLFQPSRHCCLEQVHLVQRQQDSSPP